MKYVYILENDLRSIHEILEALEKIDPKFQPRIFYNLRQFANWIELLTKIGKKAIARGGSLPGTPSDSKYRGYNDDMGSDQDQLICLISNNDIFGRKNLSLMRKVQNLFIEKDVCKKESPTALVITAFNNPDFDPKTIEARLVNNVIIKPFDKFILIQHLIYSISGRQPPSSYNIHKLKTSAMIEMLKEVDVEAFSMVGFITRSTRPVPVGAVAKYYGDVFIAGTTRSVFARCYKCEPHPTEKNMYRCAFTYFGTEAGQISTYRKNTLSTNKAEIEYKFTWRTKTEQKVVNFALIENDKEKNSVSGTVERMFTNAKVFKFSSLKDFQSEMGKQTFHALIAEEEVAGLDMKVWATVKEGMDKTLASSKIKPGIFLISKRAKYDKDLRELGAVFTDIFYDPVERNYFSKKIYLFFTGLQAAEDLESKQYHRDAKIEVGNPIRVTEVSEAGLVMKYYRPITVGSFRRFILWYPPEVGMPTILGACNFNEKSKTDKDAFENHFVFYGVSDEYLKHIRIWVRENYILSKMA
jgi:hypothetical protein